MNGFGLTINPRSKWSEGARAAKVSVRELEILILHGEGKSNEEIAETLDIGYQTVKNMLHSLNKKLNTNTNAQALMRAISEKLVKLDIQSKDERDLADKIMWAIESESRSDEGKTLYEMLKERFGKKKQKLESEVGQKPTERTSGTERSGAQKHPSK